MTVYTKSMMESLAEVHDIQEDNMDLMRKAAGGSMQTIKMKDGNTSVYAHLDSFNEKLELIKEDLQSKCDCYTIDHTFSEWQFPVYKGDVIGAWVFKHIRLSKRVPDSPYI